mmetsp:Transcript_9121/g.22345  ORF Transcript_9121/g.22345 Transcript_9121/m.22345 type:complete len:289 (+) Transcript_9121:1391-2257(+)
MRSWDLFASLRFASFRFVFPSLSRCVASVLRIAVVDLGRHPATILAYCSFFGLSTSCVRHREVLLARGDGAGEALFAPLLRQKGDVLDVPDAPDVVGLQDVLGEPLRKPLPGRIVSFQASGRFPLLPASLLLVVFRRFVLAALRAFQHASAELSSAVFEGRDFGVSVPSIVLLVLGELERRFDVEEIRGVFETDRPASSLFLRRLLLRRILRFPHFHQRWCGRWTRGIGLEMSSECGHVLHFRGDIDRLRCFDAVLRMCGLLADHHHLSDSGLTGIECVQEALLSLSC